MEGSSRALNETIGIVRRIGDSELFMQVRRLFLSNPGFGIFLKKLIEGFTQSRFECLLPLSISRITVDRRSRVFRKSGKELSRMQSLNSFGEHGLVLVKQFHREDDFSDSVCKNHPPAAYRAPNTRRRSSVVRAAGFSRMLFSSRAIIRNSPSIALSVA